MKMTKNEARAYMRECASKLYNESGYTMKDYERDCDSIELIPLDLSKYPSIKPETAKWIDKLFNEEDVDKNGNYMLRGFTYHPIAEKDVMNMQYGDGDIDSINFWAFNEDEMLIYTYCEGDTTLHIFSTKDAYDKEYEEQLKWYRRNE